MTNGYIIEQLRARQVCAMIILCMRPAIERRCYNVTSSLIGRAHAENDPCLWNSLVLKIITPHQNGFSVSAAINAGCVIACARCGEGGVLTYPMTTTVVDQRSIPYNVKGYWPDVSTNTYALISYPSKCRPSICTWSKMCPHFSNTKAISRRIADFKFRHVFFKVPFHGQHDVWWLHFSVLVTSFKIAD